MDKIRQWWYLVAGAIAALIPILVQLNVLSGRSAESGGLLLESLSSLIGGGAAITAGAVLSKQRKQGLPELVKQAPIDLVVNNIPVVYQQMAQAEANVQKMKDVAADVLGGLTGGLIGGMTATPTPFVPDHNANQALATEQSLANSALSHITR